MELFSCGSHPADWKESSDWNKEVRWTTVWRLAVLLGKWNFHWCASCLCTHLIHPTRHSCLPRFVTTPNIVLWYNIWNNILPHFCVVKSNIDDLKDTCMHSLKTSCYCTVWSVRSGPGQLSQQLVPPAKCANLWIRWANLVSGLYDTLDEFWNRPIKHVYKIWRYNRVFTRHKSRPTDFGADWDPILNSKSVARIDMSPFRWLWGWSFFFFFFEESSCVILMVRNVSRNGGWAIVEIHLQRQQPTLICTTCFWKESMFRNRNRNWSTTLQHPSEIWVFKSNPHLKDKSSKICFEKVRIEAGQYTATCT